MLIGIEKFLFGNFGKMPPAVRVFTYLFVLFLFAYLLLTPRFINGQMVVKSKAGGWRPYRAGELQMHVEGRVFKFKANEEGYWSIPTVSLLPHTLLVKALHFDADEWFPLSFKWHELWTRDIFHIVITNDPAGVKLERTARAGDSVLARTGAALQMLVATDPAVAGELQIPRAVPSDPRLLSRIEVEVIGVVAEATGKDPGQVRRAMPLTGPSAPPYAQRIEIVENLERKFRTRIPDEHWIYLNTVGELVDYVQKAEIYRRSLEAERGRLEREPEAPKATKPVAPPSPVPTRDTARERPIFKR